MSGGIQQQRQMVEQLRREAANKRAPLTQTIEDIKVSSVTFLFWWYDGKDPESFRDLCKNIAVRTSCFMDSRGRMPILTGLFILKASTILMKKLYDNNFFQRKVLLLGAINSSTRTPKHSDIQIYNCNGQISYWTRGMLARWQQMNFFMQPWLLIWVPWSHSFLGLGNSFPTCKEFKNNQLNF